MSTEQSPIATDDSSLPASPHTPSSSNSGCHSTSHLSAGRRTPQERRANKRNERGETPLHLAAIKGDGQQAKKLIKAGADVNVIDFAGWTPLHEACNHGWLDVAELLLNAGANVNVQGLDNDTPLHDASVNGHEKLVELLVHHGADALQSNSRGKTPLDVAASSVITKLLKKEHVDVSNIGERRLASRGSRSPEPSSKRNSSERESSKDKNSDIHPAKSLEEHRKDAEDSKGCNSLDKDKHCGSITERCGTVPRGVSLSASSTSENGGTASSGFTSRQHISPKAKVSSGTDDITGLSTSTPVTVPISVSITSSATEPLTTQTKSFFSTTDKKSPFAVYTFEDDPSEDEGLRSLHTDRDVPCYTSPRITDKDKLSPKTGTKSPKADRSSPKPSDSKDIHDTGKRLNVPFADKAPKSPKFSHIVTNQDKSFQTIENPNKEALKCAVSTRIDRSSPKPDRSSPKPGAFAAVRNSSVAQGKAGSPKVPPLKIIIPTKSTASSNINNTGPDTGTNKNNCTRQVLPYIVNSSQDTSGSANSNDVQNASDCSGTGAVTTTTMASVQSKMSVDIESMGVDADEPVISSTLAPNTSATTSSLVSTLLSTTSQQACAPCTPLLAATVTNIAVTGDTGGARQIKEHAAGKHKEIGIKVSNIGNDAGSGANSCISISSSSSAGTTSGVDVKNIKMELAEDDGKGVDVSATAKGPEFTREKRVTRSAARTAQQKQKQFKGDDRDVLPEDKDDEASNSSVTSTTQQSSSTSATDITSMTTIAATVPVTVVDNIASTSNVNLPIASASSSSGRDEETHVPPRKRKPRQHKDLQINSNKHVGTGETTVKVESDIVNYGASGSSTNPTQQYLNIRGQVDKRRRTQEMVVPKAPQGYCNFRSVTKEYMLESNASNYASAIRGSNPKPNLQHPALQELYKDQEEERQNLRTQHLVQQERLQLSVEQEVMREHGRAARAMSNHEVPLSFTTVLIDAEVYSPLVDEEDEKEKNVRCRYNARTLLQWLQDVRDKYEKIKESTLKRHKQERDSLHATQRMHWGWKLREIGQCEPRATPAIDASFVPLITVDDDFDLLPSQ